MRRDDRGLSGGRDASHIAFYVIDPGEPPDLPSRTASGLCVSSALPPGYCAVRLGVDAVCALPRTDHPAGVHRDGNGDWFAETEQDLQGIGSRTPWPPVPVEECRYVLHGPFTPTDRTEHGPASEPEITQILRAQARREIMSTEGGLVATVWVHEREDGEPYPLVGHLQVPEPGQSGQQARGILIADQDLDLLLAERPWIRLTFHLQAVRVAVPTTVLRVGPQLRALGLDVRPGTLIRLATADAQALTGPAGSTVERHDDEGPARK